MSSIKITEHLSNCCLSFPSDAFCLYEVSLNSLQVRAAKVPANGLWELTNYAHSDFRSDGK